MTFRHRPHADVGSIPPVTPRTGRAIPRGLTALPILAITACTTPPATPQTDVVRPGAGEDLSGRTDTGGEDTGGTDGAATPPALGQFVLDACLGTTGIAERCTLVANASACTEGKCSKLVVVFSGGDMGCTTGSGYHDVLTGYAAHGYAAVCIDAFDSPEGSGAAPYVDEAERIDVAVREATTGAWARAYWTGEDLLLQGISHGATAPVILMARTDLDNQPHWHGTRRTAGCFFDGSYDQAATASLLASGASGGNACTWPVPYTRWLRRYCGPGATEATCDLASHPKAQDDTLTDILATTIAVLDFKMFECGSALRACTGDIVPAEPIAALCRRLDSSPSHTCSYTTLPTDGHLACHANHYDACRSWFDGLPPP